MVKSKSVSRYYCNDLNDKIPVWNWCRLSKICDRVFSFLNNIYHQKCLLHVHSLPPPPPRDHDLYPPEYLIVFVLALHPAWFKYTLATPPPLLAHVLSKACCFLSPQRFHHRVSNYSFYCQFLLLDQRVFGGFLSPSNRLKVPIILTPLPLYWALL